MMREHTVNKWDVDTCFPVFEWVKCEFCNNEYRREKVYFRYMGTTRLHACTMCVCSVSHYNDRIDHRWATIRAEQMKFVPPPPPMRTYRKQ